MPGQRGFDRWNAPYGNHRRQQQKWRPSLKICPPLYAGAAGFVRAVSIEAADSCSPANRNVVFGFHHFKNTASAAIETRADKTSGSSGPKKLELRY